MMPLSSYTQLESLSPIIIYTAKDVRCNGSTALHDTPFQVNQILYFLSLDHIFQMTPQKNQAVQIRTCCGPLHQPSTTYSCPGNCLSSQLRSKKKTFSVIHLWFKTYGTSCRIHSRKVIKVLTTNIEISKFSLMSSFQNVRYRFYRSINWLTDVLALHERMTAHWSEKGSANLQGQ